MEKMLYEVNYCKKVMTNNFNKPLKMTDEDEQILRKLANVIFVIKNILIKIFVLDITVM